MHFQGLARQREERPWKVAIRGGIATGSLTTSSSDGALGTLLLPNGQIKVRFTLDGDADLSGNVNVADLANLAGNFGKTSGQFWIDGDFDDNGNVNVADLADLAGSFGKDLSSAGLGESAVAFSAAALPGAAAVPEPASVALLASLIASALTARRRRQGLRRNNLYRAAGRM
jgi:hypothetical protein